MHEEQLQWSVEVSKNHFNQIKHFLCGMYWLTFTEKKIWQSKCRWGEERERERERERESNACSWRQRPAVREGWKWYKLTKEMLAGGWTPTHRNQPVSHLAGKSSHSTLYFCSDGSAKYHANKLLSFPLCKWWKLDLGRQNTGLRWCKSSQRIFMPSGIKGDWQVSYLFSPKDTSTRRSTLLGTKGISGCHSSSMNECENHKI